MTSLEILNVIYQSSFNCSEIDRFGFIKLITYKRDYFEEIFFKLKLLSAETRPPKSLQIEFF